ncbi:E3 SUMO-protein ligase NSE2-like [Lingula anatina]|uniref:E3 SUMO-protein ligase NSE2 n=1 Tax=Lingula anatina TaxID=7574 RepID=A0A1S3HJ22_LINAN|nr:E3 SUMO-protein ligase NSE2-like [Lingula anatina]|eukprot:XP_013384994.1 E3 SUMO-protein ligase NSE2-like [Lingula anatina]
MPGNHQARFAVVDQALEKLDKVKDYITVGMETVIDVTQDFVQCDKGESTDKENELKDMMLQYISMEAELQHFLSAVDHVKTQSTGDTVGMADMLDREFTERKKTIDPARLQEHIKYKDLNQKIWDTLHPDELMPEQASLDLDDDDLAMTQQVVVTKCPYTGQEMINPMRNKLCDHRYDRAAVEEMLKKRGSRAKCPVAGCANTKPISQDDLEEDNKFKRYIETKNRQEGKRTKRPGRGAFNV